MDKLETALQNQNSEKARRLIEQRDYDLTSHKYFQKALKSGCLRLAHYLADNVNGYETVGTLYKLIPFEQRHGNMVPLRFVLGLDEPISRIERYKTLHNDSQHVYKHLVQGWVEARAHDADNLARDMGRFLDDHLSTEDVREALSYYPRRNKPAAEQRPLHYALANHNDDERIERLIDTFVPTADELALMMHHGHMEAARADLEYKNEAAIDLTDPDQRIPRQDPEPGQALLTYNHEYGCKNMTNVFRGPDHLRALVQQSDRSVQASVLVGLVKAETDRSFEQYAPVVLDESSLTTVVEELGFVQYSRDVERGRAEALLLYVKDRGKLSDEALRQAATHQLDRAGSNLTKPDADFLRLLYRFGLTFGDQAIQTAAMTTEVASTILSNDDLSKQQHNSILAQSMYDENDMSPEQLLNKGFRPIGLKGYQTMLTSMDVEITRGDLTALFRAWSNDPAVDLAGTRIVEECTEGLDFSWTNRTGFKGPVFWYALRAGWQPADEEHLRAVYKTMYDYVEEHNMAVTHYGEALIKHRMPPPPDIMEQFKAHDFLYDEWLEAMDGRQRKAYELQQD